MLLLAVCAGPFVSFLLLSFLSFLFDVYRAMNPTFFLFFFGLMVNQSWMMRYTNFISGCFIYDANVA